MAGAFSSAFSPSFDVPPSGPPPIIPLPPVASPILDIINALRPTPLPPPVNYALNLPQRPTPIWAIEALGGRMVESFNTEPDPVTYWADYYYNSRINKLFTRKWIINDKFHGVQVAKWIPISQGMTQKTVSKTVAAALAGSGI